jgi:hypothetical protein
MSHQLTAEATVEEVDLSCQTLELYVTILVNASVEIVADRVLGCKEGWSYQSPSA